MVPCDSVSPSITPQGTFRVPSDDTEFQSLSKEWFKNIITGLRDRVVLLSQRLPGSAEAEHSLAATQILLGSY